MKDSIPLQYLFDSVQRKDELLKKSKESPVGSFTHKAYVQMAWGERKAAQKWAEELSLSLEERLARDLADSLKYLSEEVVTMRDIQGRSKASIKNWAGCWADSDTGIFPKGVRALTFELFFGEMA